MVEKQSQKSRGAMYGEKGRVQRLLATINREPKQKNKQLCHPEFEEEEM